MRDALRPHAICCWLAGVGVAVFAWPGNAQAHSPVAGIGTFYSAMLHPLVVPTHALVLVALSLAVAQHGRVVARRALILLFVAFGSGLAAAMSRPDAAASEPAVLIIAALIAASVSIARPLPFWMIAIAAIAAGTMLGLESRPDPANRQETVLAVAGVCVGIALLCTLIAGTCLTFDKAWQKVGVRIVGSWIVAASVLVLTLLMHSGRQTEILFPVEPAERETLS